MSVSDQFFPQNGDSLHIMIRYGDSLHLRFATLAIRYTGDSLHRFATLFCIKESILSLAVVNLISFANFDAEVAAYSSFQEVFPGMSVKLCSFHVKQGLYRKVFIH
uniref:MULE transposase domain-containing protein n=1 Tax=Ditylenchus dipsaci TaxID=166011 RepID=A0A915DJF8_9BILA